MQGDGLLGQFGTARRALLGPAAELLREAGYSIDIGRKMAPATMGSVLREQLAAGEDVPLDLFGAERVRKSTIKQGA